MKETRDRKKIVTFIENVTLGYIRQKLEDSLGVVAGFTIQGTDWTSSMHEDGLSVHLTIRDRHFKPYIDKKAAFNAWIVEVLGQPQRRAYIEEARAEAGIRLTIKDPISEDHEPIGPPFEEFCQMAISDCIFMGEEERATDDEGLWLKIPDHGWDRIAVKLLHKRHSSKEIARRVGRDEKTVNNRLSELRGQFGSEIVPYRKRGPRKLG